jgi:hypothetical protein
MHNDTDQTITDPTRRYRCRHVFTDGHRCGSPSLRTQDFCYYHHASRREPSLAPGHGMFLMPRIDDRAAIQIALYDILARITLRDIELKTAGMLLYGLQIASSNIAQQEKSARLAIPNPEPLVDEVTSNLLFGDLAPIAEYAEPKPKEETPLPTVQTGCSIHDSPIVMSGVAATPTNTQNSVILSEEHRDESKDPDTFHSTPTVHNIPPQNSAGYPGLTPLGRAATVSSNAPISTHAPLRYPAAYPAFPACPPHAPRPQRSGAPAPAHSTAQ